MGDSTNWEFAAAVAGVSIGLGGLLLFTLIGTFGSWRVFDHASRAAEEAAQASVAVQDLARQVSARDAMVGPAIDISQSAGHLSELRRQADALIEQQSRLQDAVRNLVEAGVLRSESPQGGLQELQASIHRLEDNLARVAAAVANIGASSREHTA